MAHWGPDKQVFATHAQEVDMINHPNHYNQFSREVIDTMKGKNGAEDLDKAIWYIGKLKSEISE